jgi:hypothetical protein
MLETLRSVPGDRLGVDEYLSDFWPYFKNLHEDFLKLERRQTFREPADPSWRALDAGDWPEAVRLVDERRDEIQASVREVADFTMRRVRIAERPYTPYLQWELYYIRLRMEAGEGIRVLNAADVQSLERLEPLPELVILDSSVMYEVLYDKAGDHEGARKILDPDIIRAARREVENLYEAAEDLESFFENDPSSLPPPVQGAAKGH